MNKFNKFLKNLIKYIFINLFRLKHKFKDLYDYKNIFKY